MFTVENHGTIVLIRPSDDVERKWLMEHAGEDAQWWGAALGVEPRYVCDLCGGIVEAGFVIDKW